MWFGQEIQEMLFEQAPGPSIRKHRTRIKPGQKIDLDLAESEHQYILGDQSYIDVNPELSKLKTAKFRRFSCHK
jgi:hypothetical protein